ncbi:MAG: hypothetical protein ACOH1T_12420 [Microbacteriaceae bacterium]
MVRAQPAAFAVVLALAVATTFSGCAETGAIYSDVVISSELDGLQRDLEPLGAELTYTSEMGADFHYTVFVTLEIDDADRSGLEDVITRSIEKLRGDVFTQQKVNLTVESGDDHVFGVSNPSTIDALDDVLDYWFTLRDAAGAPLAMNINSDPEYDGYTLSFAASEPVDFDALRAVGDGGHDNNVWFFPGIDAYGPPPASNIADVFAELFEVLPPLDYYNPGVRVQWSDDRATLEILGVDVVGAASLADSATWPSVVDITRLAADRSASLTFYGDGAGGADSVYAMVHFGTCETVPPASPVDLELFTLLAAQVALPAGSGPGICET